MIRLGVFIFFCFAMSANTFADWRESRWQAMGTQMSLDFFYSEQDADKIIDHLQAETERLEALLSDYRPDSDVSRINRLAGQSEVRVSKEVFTVIRRAVEVSMLTQGAFDITFAGVGQFYKLRKQQQPEQETIESSLQKINYRNIELNEETGSVYLNQAGMKIGLGGIAKGYVVDRLIEVLQSYDIRHAVVTAGGDTRIIGDKLGKPWMIGIKDPRNANEVAVTLPLSDTAFSTSGDYERFFMKDGERIHHILSPKTGRPTTGIQSVSIITDKSIDADAFSTSVFVLGVEKGIALVEGMPNYEAIIIDANRKMHFTSGLVGAP